MNEVEIKANHVSIWKNKGLVIYLSGNMLSTLGSSIADLAIMWLLQETTGSTSRAEFAGGLLPTWVVISLFGAMASLFTMSGYLMKSLRAS